MLILTVMAEQKGIIKLKGKIDGHSTYYHSPTGKWIIRRNGIRTREMLMQKKCFARVREHMSEFGVASRIGKSIRRVLQHMGKGYTESYISGKLTSSILQIIQSRDGEKGQRQLEPGTGILLKDYALNDALRIHSKMLYSNAIEIVSNRDAVNIDLTIKQQSAPSGATHYGVKLIAGGISDWQYNEGYSEQYDLRHVYAISTLPELAITSDLITSVNLQLPPAIPNDAGIALAIGVCYYQKVNGKLHELSEKYGEIIGVY